MTLSVGGRQKLFLLLTISILFTGCVSTPKITYKEDIFYPQNSEYATDFWGDFRFIKRANNKIYLQGFIEENKSFYVESTDTIDLKFTDGTIIKLNYDGYISQPRSYNFNDFYLLTELKAVEEWKPLELIRVETSLGYENYQTNPNLRHEKLTLYNRLKNNEYDEIKTKD